MPYIEESSKQYLNTYGMPRTTGELNYKITMLLKEYLHGYGKSYSTINDILGALEGAKLEFVRRIVNPYEDVKRAENGDCY